MRGNAAHFAYLDQNIAACAYNLLQKNSYCLLQRLYYGLLLTTLKRHHVEIIKSTRCIIVTVVVERCEYGMPRCPHCNARTKAACDSAAVIKDCQHDDVSQCTL